MTAAQPAALPALATIHAQRFAARQLSPTVAEVALINPAFCTVAQLTRAELLSLAAHVTQLAEGMDEAPSASLVLPEGAGSLHVPGRS